jgi:hypothetical protein
MNQKLLSKFNECISNNTAVLVPMGKNLQSVLKNAKDKDEKKYEKYIWDGSNYVHKKDETNSDLLYFSNNKWGCNDSGTGGFDKFMKLIEKQKSWGFSIESITPGQ